MYVCSGAKLDVQLHVKVALLCVGGGGVSPFSNDDARHAIILKSMAKSAR